MGKPFLISPSVGGSDATPDVRLAEWLTFHSRAGHKQLGLDTHWATRSAAAAGAAR